MAQSRCQWRSAEPLSAETSTPSIDDRAFARIDQTVDHAQQRRLAGAGAADDADHLALRDREIDRADGRVLAEAAGDAADLRVWPTFEAPVRQTSRCPSPERLAPLHEGAVSDSCRFCYSPQPTKDWLQPPCFSRKVSAESERKSSSAARRRGVVPVPPGERLVALGGLPVEALADRLGGHAADDRVGRDILRHHRAGADDRAIADRDAGQDGRAMAEPGVVADRHAAGAARGEELGLVLGVVPIVGGAVGEMVQRRARRPDGWWR